MPRTRIVSVVVDAILVVALVVIAFGGGWRLLALLLIPLFVLDLVRVFRPSAPRIRPEFTQPGGHRVILQVPGPQPVLVIREIRRTTGRELPAAKKVVDDWPAIVAEGLNEQSAELVADRLRKAGAKALAAPMGENL